MPPKWAVDMPFTRECVDSSDSLMRLLRIDLNVFNTDGAIHLSATLKQFKSRLMRLLTSWFKGIGVVALNIAVVVVSVVFGFFLLNL